ncbi:MAG: hypothetical protein IIC29_08090 [Chloroflexi bacterium]|nr:hypothetical protein [Chloroflexota bacterium]MCH8236070.1 hypothetical protein [Chloroflexota bacterium]MCH8817630.1 hypothetical protein [Chloroflexota bacterium]
MAQAGDITPDSPSTGAPDERGPLLSTPGTPAIHTARVKLAAAVVVTATLLLASALIYSDQADLYETSFAVSIIRQITTETEFQSLYLVIILTPLFVAAARNVSWIALAAGGLIMLSILMPYARWEYVDIASGQVEGAHNSLYQLAGPGHQMPQFVSVLVLAMMGGVTALFWRVRIGGLIAVLGAITMAFVWPAVLDEPPVIDDRALIVFQDDALLFGYYITWFGALIAVIGEGSLLARLTGRGRSDADSADDAVSD